MKRKNKRKYKNKKKIVFLFKFAAYIFAAILFVYPFYHLYFKTDIFDVKEIQITGNQKYDSSYIVEKSNMKLGQKILDTRLKEIKKNLEKEIYIKEARVNFELPNKIKISLVERVPKYQFLYEGKYIVTDLEGFVLKIDEQNNELITIESLSKILYNEGKSIEISKIDNFKSINNAIDYLTAKFSKQKLIKLTILENNSIRFLTEYGTKVIISLRDDVAYQVIFAMEIISDRLNKNLSVSNGIIDFTKGLSPVYIEGNGGQWWRMKFIIRLYYLQ